MAKQAKKPGRSVIEKRRDKQARRDQRAAERQRSERMSS